MNIHDYRPGMQITNVEQLPAGTGARYLEVLISHAGPLIVVQWRRKKPRSLPKGRALIRFQGETK